MTVDLEPVLHRHFARSRAAVLPPGSWDRLEERLADASPGEARLGGGAAGPDRRRALLVAAVAIVLAVGAAVLAGQRDGDGGERLDTVDSAPSSAPTASASPEPADPDTSPSSEPMRAARHSSVAVLLDRDADGLGEVALLGADGMVTTLVPEHDDDPPPVEGTPHGALDLDVATNGVIYYETCCEPAVGEVRGFDLTTGEDLGFVAYGRFPTVSPDGRWLATSQGGDDVVLTGLVDGAEHVTVALPPSEAPGPGRIVTGLAWSPDGRTLAVGRLRFAGDEGVSDVGIDLIDIESGAAEPVIADEWSGPVAMPAFLPDGRLVVGTGARPRTDDGYELVVTGLGIVDGVTRRIEPRVEGVELIGVDTSEDGGWLVTTAVDGTLHVYESQDDLRDDGPWSVPDRGVIAAAW